MNCKKTYTAKHVMAIRRKLEAAERRIAKLEEAVSLKEDARAVARAEVNLLMKTNSTLRAMVCQLRTYQTSKHGRTGWGVTAFIPNSVLEAIKGGDNEDLKRELKEEVIESLVDLALRGIWDVVEGRLKSVCVVYRPLEVTKVDEHGRALDIKVPTQKHGAPHVILEKDCGDDPDEAFRTYDPNDSSTWGKGK